MTVVYLLDRVDPYVRHSYYPYTMRTRLLLLLVIVGSLLFPADEGLVRTCADDAAPLPMSTASEAGFGLERLDRLHATLQAAVDKGKCSGYVTLLARHGRIADWRNYGYRDLATRAPMEKDTIVRIYSNSKLITSVGAMILFEENRLDLDAPIETYLPKLAKRKVLKGGTPASPELIDAVRPVTVRHLLTHTSGFIYDFGGNDTLSRLYRKSGIMDSASLEQFVERAATLPLNHQPGAEFRYGISTDLLGAVIEKVSGKDLETFVQDRLLRPLRMLDTSFDVAPEEMSRLARVYQRDKNGKLVEAEAVSSSFPEAGRGFPSGGGGMFSTAVDYARFAQMLLNGGELDGVRILGRKTVEYMTLNHLGRTNKLTHQFSESRGFGLGAEVMIDVAKSSTMGSLGQFGWYGAATTYCQIDPQEDLVAIALFQHFPMDEPKVFQSFANGYYAALVD
jgi:CubicO group peptidase (beta-lactamase class C family)